MRREKAIWNICPLSSTWLQNEKKNRCPLPERITPHRTCLMKRIFSCCLLLIIILTACRSSSASATCKKGICINIEVKGPVQALEPARFIISVKTKKDVNELPIGLSAYSNVSISDIEKIPEGAKLVYEDENMLDWQINTKNGEENFFVGHIILSKPKVSYGIFGYSIMTFFSQPEFGRVTDSITIYLDADGNQVEESQVKKILKTGFPPPTPAPDLTIVPETRFQPSCGPPRPFYLPQLFLFQHIHK